MAAFWYMCAWLAVSALNLKELEGVLGAGFQAKLPRPERESVPALEHPKLPLYRLGPLPLPLLPP